MNTPQQNHNTYSYLDIESCIDDLKQGNSNGIFDMAGLYQKQNSLPNKGIMNPILKRMGMIGNRLKEIYQQDIDPVSWLAWCYYDQEYSCKAISVILANMGIEYKDGSLSQFTFKQCNWKKRPHTHITTNGKIILREMATIRQRVKRVCPNSF